MPPQPPARSLGEAAGALLRSLNALMKSVRLYGAQHQRAIQYLQEVQSQVEAALAMSDSLVFGVTGNRVSVNGRPLPNGTAESSFADLLNAADIGSVQFFSGVTTEEVQAFAVAFSTKNRSELAKFAENTSTHIHLNELQFVAQGGGSGGGEGNSAVTSEVVAALISPDAAKAVPAAAPAEPAKAAEPVASVNPEQAAIHWIEQIARQVQQGDAGAEGEAPLDEGTRAFLDRLQLQVKAGKTDDSQQLLQLAERCALRYALERYQSGEVKAGAVNPMLQKLVSEVSRLRKMVGIKLEPEKAEQPADTLQREFWNTVPTKGKLMVLLTPDAWCIPAANVESFVQELLTAGDTETANKVLMAYVACTASSDREARLKSAQGTLVLAGALAQAGPETMTAAVVHVAHALASESDPEVETALSLGLARLTQQALTRRYFQAVNQTLSVLRHLEQHRPESAAKLRPRIRLDERLPELVREAVEADALKSEFITLLKRVPRPAMRAVLDRFERSQRRTIADRLANVAAQLGEEANDYLVGLFRDSNSAEASRAVGMLSRLGHPVLDEEFVQRIAGWSLAHQEAAIRQLATAGGKTDRGMILLGALKTVNPVLKPVVLDEIGCSGDERTAPELMRIALLDDEANAYLRLKAIEALGRMREAKAIPLLRDLILARNIFAWRQPDEVRVAALHSLQLIHPQAASEQAIVNAVKGVPASLLCTFVGNDWRKQRRYVRSVPNRPLTGAVTTARLAGSVSIDRLSLGGGLAARQSLEPLGLDGTIEFMAARRKLHARVLFHEIGSRRITFEIVDISLDDRWRLRRMLVDEAHVAADEPHSETAAEPEPLAPAPPD